MSVLRELVLEALLDLGEGWIPWVALERYFRSDHRIPGLTRLFRRWAERVGVEAVDPLVVARRIVHESLPALGLLDLGEDDELADAEPDSTNLTKMKPEERARREADRAVVLRLTPRGRGLLSAKTPSRDETKSKFIDANAHFEAFSHAPKSARQSRAVPDRAERGTGPRIGAREETCPRATSNQDVPSGGLHN